MRYHIAVKETPSVPNDTDNEIPPLLPNEENVPTRWMTRRTFDKLTELKRELEDELRGYGGENDSGHQRSALHDNAATEHRRNMVRARLLNIGNLEHVGIIAPPQDLTRVALGTQVVIDYGGGDTMIGVVLSEDDFVHAAPSQWGTGVEVISKNGPLGQLLLGKSVGAEIEFKRGKDRQSVRLLSISAGDINE